MALALMRRHRRWLYVFLWLVIAAFIILYIPALDQQPEGSPGETVVNVGGLPISVGEFRRVYYQQRQMYDRLYEGRLEEPMVRQIQQQVLESLVSERLVELEARRLGISVSDEAVARAIRTSPEYQDDGRFIGTDEIRRRLDLSGTSEEQLAESLRRRLMRERLESLVGSAAHVSPAELERELRRRGDQVKLEYVLADAARHRASIAPTEEEIKARFEANKDDYRLPERRVVSYVLLDRETLRPQVTVTDRELELYYLDHRDDFRQEEEACASHVLVKVKQGEQGEGHVDEEARQIAEKLLAEIKGGADFAAVARRASEDPGSAQNGGDLGCFTPGRMVSEFDSAVFDMKPGELSELVKSSFGYHIIRLGSKRESSVPPLAQVKERIRAIVSDRKLSQLGEQKAQAIADALGQGKTLEQAAQAQGLTVRKSEPIVRGETPPVLASPTLVARVFELKQGEAEKEGFALPQGAAFVALAEVQPARLPELAEVKDKVRGEIVEERALAQARALAERVRAAAEKGSLEKAASAAGLVRKETPQLEGRGQAHGDLGSSLLLDEVAFSLAEKTLSEPVRVPSGWALVRVLEKRTAPEAELAGQKAQLEASLRAQKQGELFRAFLVEARERHRISRDAGAYRRAVGEEGE